MKCCDQCGSTFRRYYNTCTKCGKPLREVLQQDKLCCNMVWERETDKFCGVCGRKLDTFKPTEIKGLNE